jgi:hypothetical protein
MITLILWHVDPLLGGDREVGDCTAAVARQRPANSNKGTVFSVRPVQRCCKQDNWSNQFVEGQSPAGKNGRTEAEDIVGIRHQATTGKDIAD